jgi:hypothetical protein
MRTGGESNSDEFIQTPYYELESHYLTQNLCNYTASEVEGKKKRTLVLKKKTFGGWRRSAVEEVWVSQVRGSHGQVFVHGEEIWLFGPGKPQMIPPAVAQN